MKFYWKVFLSIVILLALSFSICGTWMIHAAFKSSYDREIQMGNIENSMYQIAFKNAVEAVPINYLEKRRSIVREIADSLEKSMGKSGSYFQVWDSEKKNVYSKKRWDMHSLLFDKVNQDYSGYEVVKEEDRYWLRVVSMVSVESIKESYYIENMIDISHIYENRHQMTRTYQIIIAILLAATGTVSLMLSYYLTFPIHELSKTTRRFAGGDYRIRAKKRGNDEVGILASDFNDMADNLSDKIEQLMNHAKDQEAFTSAFAHELKTPLTAIIGYADMMRSMELTTEEKIKAAGYIYSQGKRLESLSFKLMELFVLKKQDFEFQSFDAQFLIQSVFDLSEVGILEKDMVLKREVEPGRIYGEKDMLISLFANLVDNARKASEAGDTIYIKGVKKEEGYQVSIIDQGKGMPEDAVQKITQAFYMVDKSRSRKEGGAGLGMTLCNEIVKLHGAKWNIESKEGKGTRVTVILPGEEQKLQKEGRKPE